LPADSAESATVIALWFIGRNRRSFSRREYLIVVLGCVLVDVAMQLGFTAMLIGHIATDKWVGMINIFGGHALLIALAYSPWSWAVRNYSKHVSSSYGKVSSR
jgi:arginine exporter protein ArgO